MQCCYRVTPTTAFLLTLLQPVIIVMRAEAFGEGSSKGTIHNVAEEGEFQSLVGCIRLGFRSDVGGMGRARECGHGR